MKRNEKLPDKSPIENTYVSVNGTDWSVYEPKPFSPIWYSYMINGPGLRYEIRFGLFTGKLVLAFGPSQCGAYADIYIFNEILKLQLSSH